MTAENPIEAEVQGTWSPVGPVLVRYPTFEKLLRFVPNWSSMQAIGQSPVMKLTILAPFIGSLVLFNRHIVEFLQLHAMAGHGSAGRLEFLYFGLLMLGSGSIAFALRCPPDLKRSPSVGEYVAQEESLLTRPWMGLICKLVIENYHRNLVLDEHAIWGCRPWQPAYPSEHADLFAEVMGALGAKVLTGEGWDEGHPAPIDGFGPFGVFDHLGGLNVPRFAELMRHAPTALRVLPVTLANEAMGHTIDLLALRYNDLNHSQPYWRLMVIAFYGVGFALLAVPTIWTVIAVFKSLL
ncbi:hypothetical protein J2Y55_002432 [Bosea sp. BE125]|uniref:hypothetical protein n=1 Tax=Bosea sp. BE125 TaxID=2817909 RepID=UPI0028586F6C|nr:hypothetical protein [Bosea sp. BE125]MDR6871420.1 hypothetical protein [Bosea sp. BE125]